MYYVALLNDLFTHMTLFQFKINLFFITKKKCFDKDRRGTNFHSDDEICSSFLFSSSRWPKSDVTMIVGHDNTTEIGTLLLCRFHSECGRLKKKDKQNFIEELFVALDSRKQDANRSCGSSGKPEYSVEVKQLMHTSNISPRNSKGVIWLRGDTKWYLFYIGTKDGEAKSTFYSPPVPGGKFRLPNEMIDKYPILQRCILTKCLSAVLIQQLQKDKITNMHISPQAVRLELEQIEKTIQTFIASTTGKKIIGNWESAFFNFFARLSNPLLPPT